MRTYEATDYGKQIALESGTDALAQRFVDAEYFENPFLAEIARPAFAYNPYNIAEQKAYEGQMIARAVQHARGYDEHRTLANGLAIEPYDSYWQHLAPSDQPTLFPHLKAHNFTPAIEEDRLIISGAFGATLERFKSRYPLLARSRFAEYGFRNHMEACAFVGAYVVGKVADSELARTATEAPSFTVDSGLVQRKITVSGTFHGDFVIESDRSLKRDVVSPAGVFVEFAPRETITIGGYHSIEPAITGALIVDEYSKYGLEAARSLVDQLGEVLDEFIKEGDGTVSFERGAFGDYGVGDSEYALIQLRIMMANSQEEIEEKLYTRKLMSGSYLPQSSTMFEMKSIPDGIRFQMRERKAKEPDYGIEVPRDYYQELFRALILQAQAGLGRTSPMQHIEVVQLAKKMLDGDE